MLRVPRWAISYEAAIARILWPVTWWLQEIEQDETYKDGHNSTFMRGMQPFYVKTCVLKEIRAIARQLTAESHSIVLFPIL